MIGHHSPPLDRFTKAVSSDVSKVKSPPRLRLQAARSLRSLTVDGEGYAARWRSLSSALVGLVDEDCGTVLM